jgi:RNA polymerase sigma-70 factor (ECF subfamily)
VGSAPRSDPPCDTGSFAEIVARHREYLQRAAYHLTRSADTARELVQDALVRALARFDDFTQGTNARAWLVKIMTNLFLDRLKHEDVIDKAMPELMLQNEGGQDGDLMTLLSIPDDYLYAALGALPPEPRRLIELCYLQQMRRHEVARVLGVPPGTIASRLSSARHQLKVLLLGMILKAGTP